MHAFALALLLTVPAASAYRPSSTLGELVAKRDATWSAEDAAPLAADGNGPNAAASDAVGLADPVGVPVPPGVPGAPAKPPARPGTEAQQSGKDGAPQAETELTEAAEEARDAVARAKLTQADVVAARAEAPDTKRISLTDYRLLLQRATCAAAHGPLDHGPGAGCMARSTEGREVNDEDNEEVQLCAAEGGVLVARMAPCTQASVALVALNAEEGASVGLEALVGAFAEVARQCWGQTLCVE